MKKINLLICVLILSVSMVHLSSLRVQAQAPEPTSSDVKDKFLDTLRLGLSYQAQEFHTLNQKLSDNCNCDESLRLGQRALQSVNLSLYEPLTNRWSVGANFGGSFGSVMNDNRDYKRYSFVQIKAESFYNLFNANTRLRPYLSGSIQLAANQAKAFLSLPLGAGLRYSLAKGGYLHVQTAYDGGFSTAMARNMITNVGFHVPLFRRKDSKSGTIGGYVAAQSASPMQLPTQQNEANASANTANVSSNVSGASNTAKPASNVPETAKPVSIAGQPANNPAADQFNKQADKLADNQSVNANQNEAPASKYLVRVVYFDTDRFSSDKAETEKVFNEVLAFLAENKEVMVHLSGHTDNVQSELYNLALSKKRVEWVVSKLIQRGINANRINTKYFGESAAVASNEYEKGKAANRRVDIIIR